MRHKWISNWWQFVCWFGEFIRRRKQNVWKSECAYIVCKPAGASERSVVLICAQHPGNGFLFGVFELFKTCIYIGCGTKLFCWLNTGGGKGAKKREWYFPVFWNLNRFLFAKGFGVLFVWPILLLCVKRVDWFM